RATCSSRPASLRRACARRPASRSEAGGRVAAWLADAASFESPSTRSAAPGLLQDQRAEHLVGNADAAGLGERLGIFIRQHRAPHPGADGVAERAFALDAAGHLR